MGATSELYGLLLHDGSCPPEALRRRSLDGALALAQIFVERIHHLADASFAVEALPNLLIRLHM